MPPVLNTYGVKKKKPGRLPKYIFEDVSETDDVFESLNIENIKESKALREEKRKKSKVKKRETVRKPFYSLGCSNDADSTFDRLLREGSTRSLSPPPKSSESSSSSNDSDSDLWSRPEKRIRGKKKSSPFKPGARKLRKQDKKSLEDSFFTNLDWKPKRLTKPMRGSVEDSFFTVKHTSKQENGSPKNMGFVSNLPTTPISPMVKKQKQQLNLLSPILPLNLTSTPQSIGSRNPLDFFPGHGSLLGDTALMLNDSETDRKPENFSADMFASFEREEKVNANNRSDHSLLVVDLCSTVEQGLEDCVSNSPQAVGVKCDANLSTNSSLAPVKECADSRCMLPWSDNINPVNPIKINEFRDNTHLSEDISELDVTGCSDDSDVHDSVGPDVHGEKLTLFQRSAEDAESIPSNISDPSIKDCVVLLSKCDLAEQSVFVVDAMTMDSHNPQNTIEDLSLSQKSSTLNVSTPSCCGAFANVIPLKACEVVVHRCDADPSHNGAVCSVQTTGCISSSSIELESEESKALRASVYRETAKYENNKPMNDPRIPSECKVLLSRCDDPILNAYEIVPNSECSFEVTAVPSFSLMEETKHESVATLCVRPSQIIRHSTTPEPVVLKPGKHWRRSLSILSKIRTSMGESGCRKSLAFNESKSKGKLWESSVNSLIQLQSNKEAIVEDLEESVVSIPLDETGKEDSIILCEPMVYDPASEVLKRCGQEEPLSFLKCYPSRMKKKCKKIGEGVYGEVFLYSELGNPVSVIKIIPIEGVMEVNGEPQKTYREIFSEVCVAQELSDLRKGTENIARTFNEVQAIRCVRGSYPGWLQDLWHEFNDTKGSENDCPDIFEDDQLYIVLELRHGGTDLESFVFSSADQGLAAFKQIALTLAVGEKALNFEHRDLHWGNVLLASTKSKTVDFLLNGESRSVVSKGVEVSVIDFTLSRITHPETGSAVFYDLSQDETLFTAQGDYQFEIYRLMKDYCGNKWDCFTPKTNIAWLHYLLDKFCTMARYKNRTSKVHGSALDKLNELKDTVLMYNDVVSFVNCSLFCN